MKLKNESFYYIPEGPIDKENSIEGLIILFWTTCFMLNMVQNLSYFWVIIYSVMLGYVTGLLGRKMNWYI